MKPNRRHISSHRLGALLLATLLPLATTSATDLAQVPLYTVTSVPPNIFFLNDDSDSMNGETLIDDTANMGLLSKVESPALDYNNVSGIKPLKSTITAPPGGCAAGVGYGYVLQATVDIDRCTVSAEEEWRTRFYEVNPLYYNPNTLYRPWPGNKPGNDNSPFENMSLDKARIEPVGGNANNTINLTDESAVFNNGTRNYYGTDTWKNWCAAYAPNTTCKGWRYYYRDADNKIAMQWVKDLDDTIPAGWPHSRQTNFANWFTYHRSRTSIAKYAIATAVINAAGSRLGYGAINDIKLGTTNDIVTIDNNNSAKVLEKLYTTFGNGQTPLQNGLKWAGDYYEAGGEPASPILPADKGGACQINNTILMTDGFYTDSPDFASTSTINNYDGTMGAPYADSYSNTLADIAMYYYDRDLAPSIDNKVPSGIPNKHLPQHMNTYTISLGLMGEISNPDIKNLNNLVWPDPQTSSIAPVIPARIDDLFHAAVNGRGDYILASDPEKLVKSLNNIVTDITGSRSSSNTVSTSSFRLDDGDLVIATSFDPADWSGTVKALRVNADGTLNEAAPVWSSDNTLRFGDSRAIITYSGTTGISFQWDNLTRTQQSSLYLTGDDETDETKTAYAQRRLKYLRGEKVTDPNTDDSITFRERRVPLGDIVNSSPVHVGVPNLLYPDTGAFGASGNRYSKFWKDKKARTPMVYVGANDGMLHGFRMSDGKERLAYAPGALFSRLKNITAPNFNTRHEYFVDQTPTVADAFFSNDWHTVLVSGLGAGGRGLFALDITDPDNFSEDRASTLALWEFTSADDPDLGYTLAKPAVVMTEDNKWVVISGNGYGSDNGKAALFILDIKPDLTDGWSGDFTKIVAKMGPDDKSDDDKSDNVNSPNALFTAAAIDSDGNSKVDRVYAGDLKGNLWVFDLSSTNRSSWSVAKLFTATSDSKAQPITSKPTVIRHPTQPTNNSNKPNMMVMFGTGKYLTHADLSNSDQQGFYAVWDDGHGRNLTPGRLARQTLTSGKDATLNLEARLTENLNINYSASDDNKQYGWYLDLYNPNEGDPIPPSERVVTNATVYQGIVFFTTYIPSSDPCKGGGESWLMFLKTYNGGPPDKPIVSINNNRTIEADADVVNLPNDGKDTAGAPSGLKLKGGAFGFRLNQESIITSKTSGNEEDVDGGKGLDNYAHNLGVSANPGKRISWRELRRE